MKLPPVALLTLTALTATTLAHAEGTEQPAPQLPPIPPELVRPALWLADPWEGSTHPFYLALGGAFALLLLGGLGAYLLAPRLLHGHRVRVRLWRRGATGCALVGGLGLFWTAARLAGLPLFARPLWLWFTLLLFLALVGYTLFYYWRRYPAELSAYEALQRRRRWMPTPRKRAAARRR
ncbi:MAG TPA: hypothetical protein VFB73_17990 [Chloroflexota bacterium]|nr:hypothetical protein [Chloroflexota bacterium]